MTPWQCFELTVLVAGKLEVPIAVLGSLDFQMSS